MIVSYRDLLVWQLGMDLVARVYALTRGFPADERFGLTSQARRAAVSVPANIAEGRTRTHRKVYLHHLSIAVGSLSELETHLLIAAKLGYLKQEDVAEALVTTGRLGRMLHGLARRLRTPAGLGRVV